MADWRDHISGGMAWRERPGAGPVAVCLHGIGSRATGWAGLAPHLPGWRLIAWDAPGYGTSAPLNADWPVAQDYAAALEAWLAALGLTGVHLVGHSLGTLIGAAQARAFPARLSSLTLVSCAQGGGAAPGALPAAQQARLDDLGTLGAAAFARSRAPRLIHAPQDNPALVALVAGAMASVTLPGYAQAVRMLATGDLAADCAALEVPTAVIVGAEDQITPLEQSRRAHAALRHPRGLTLVPGCGHALPLQAPAALAQILIAQATCAPIGAMR